MKIKIISRDNIYSLLQYCKESGYVSIDYETDDLIKIGIDGKEKIISFSLSFQIGSSYVYVFNGDDNYIIDFLKEIYGNYNIVKIGHNIKYDNHCAHILGIRKFRGQFHDTLTMHHLINCKGNHDLGSLVNIYIPRFKDYKKLVDRTNILELDKDELIAYNAIDSEVTLELYFIFTELLMEDKRLYTLFRNLVSPLNIVLFKMELYGMLIDKEFLDYYITKTEELIKSYENKLRENKTVKAFQLHVNKALLQEEISKLSIKLLSAKNEKTKNELSQRITDLKSNKITIEKPINFNSPKQMSLLLYTSAGFNFPVEDEYKTDSGEVSTGKQVLELLPDKSGFIKNLLIYRQLNKIYSTYLIGIRDKLDKRNYIHGKFNQHGTITGRLSSNDPNMQNIITRTKYSEIEDLIKIVKRSFIVPENYFLVQADYSQAELRLMAEFSQDKNMLSVFQNDGDLHEMTAAKMRNMTIEEFRKLPEDEYKRYRYEAKSANFGLLYKMSINGYKEYAKANYGIDLTLDQATKMVTNFFKTYSAIPKYHELYIAKARKFGYVRTLSGRKVFIENIMDNDNIKRGYAERTAVNAPIQGTAGELTMFALVLLNIILPKEILMVNTVHDSIIFYIPEDYMDYIKYIKNVMENLPLEHYFGKGLKYIKMKVDFEFSKKSWGELEKLENL